MPRAVSQLSIYARHPGFGERSRPAGAEAKPPASSFAQLLGSESEAPPPSPKHHSERAQVTPSGPATTVGGPPPDKSAAPEPPATNQDPESAVAPQIVPPQDTQAAPVDMAAAVATREDSKIANGDSQDATAAVAEAAATTVSSSDPNAAQPVTAPPATVIPVLPTMASATSDPGPSESTEPEQLTGMNGSMKIAVPGPTQAGMKQTQPGQKDATSATTPTIPIAAQTADTTGTPNAAHNPSAGTTPAAVSDPAAGDARNPPESAPQDLRHAHLNSGPASRSEDGAQTPREIAAPHIAPHPGAGASAANPAADGTQVAGMQQPAQPLGNPAAPTNAYTAPVPIAGLAVEIAARAQAGRNRFEIRLDPPELGRIDVRLDVDSNGQVTSRLLVERAETLDVLRRDAGDLERALQQAGLKTSDNGLQFALRDQGFAGRNDNSTPPNTARLIVPDRDLAQGETLQDYSRARRIGGGIDIHV